MEQYFASEMWQKHVYWDKILHRAVNRSLDMTIESLGREEFENKLEEFVQLRGRVTEECANRIRWPCKREGKKNKKNDCISHDFGCGFKCMNDAIANLSNRAL
jgi:hypothetical protein